MKVNHKFHLLFYPNKQRTQKGLTPLYVRIYVNGVRSEFSTTYKIKEVNWDKSKAYLKATSPNAHFINSHLDEIRNKITQLFAISEAANETISAKDLRDKFLGREEKENEKTLMEAFVYHNDKMAEKVQSGFMSSATLLKYKITKDKVEKFIEHRYKKPDYVLSELKYAFITEFEHYLFTIDKLQSNTAYKYIKNLKRIINIAVELEWMKHSPFTQFKCSYKSPDRTVLTQLEIDQLINKEISLPRLSEVRDVFVFCCYTGFAYSDVHKLKKSNLSVGIDGETWLTTFRKKSGEKESLPLLPFALEIVEKYKDHEYCIKFGKLLPVNSNQRYNAYLKEVADLCGISKNLTTHMARHTFATTITLSNGVPIETVSKMLGHTKLATTQIYAKVLDRKVSEDMRQLREKLNPKIEQIQLQEKNVI